MKTTTTLLCLFAFLLTGTFAYAQQGQGRMSQNIRTKKIIFITEKVDLTPEEAQVFWPVYNEFDKKMDEFRKSKRALLPHGPELDNLSTKEVEEKVDALVELNVREAELQREYHARFKEVLPVEKIARLYMAEEMFRRRLMEELGRKRGEGRGPGNGQGRGQGPGNGQGPPPQH